MDHHRTRQALAATLVAGGLVLGVLASAGADGTGPPQAVHWVGPYDSQLGCVKCHEQEVRTWEASRHGRDVSWLDESGEAQEIVTKLGLTRAPTQEPLCQNCHVSKYDDGSIQRRSISCERCHGAAGGWVGRHCDYRDQAGRRLPYDQRQQEPLSRKAARVQDCERAKMLRSDMLQETAVRCLACHTLDLDPAVAGGITIDTLLQAGHPFGSKEFELVQYSQGEVRHNFLHGGANLAPSGHALDERCRALYVAGVLVDIDRSLSRLARCGTEDKNLWKALASRLRSGLRTLKKVTAAADEATPAAPALLRDLNAIQDAVPKYSPTLKLDDGAIKGQDELVVASGTVAGLVRRILADRATVHRVETLTALDEELPGADDYIWWGERRR